MKITYDAQADALYIGLKKSKFKENREVAEGIILDLGENGAVLGIEVLEARSRLSRAELSRVEVSLPLARAGRLSKR